MCSWHKCHCRSNAQYPPQVDISTCNDIIAEVLILRIFHKALLGQLLVSPLLFFEIINIQTYFRPIGMLIVLTHHRSRYRSMFIWWLLFNWERGKQNAEEKPKPDKKKPEPKPDEKKPKPERKGRRVPQEPREPKTKVEAHLPLRMEIGSV
jgi:hypothetical protein